MILLRRNKLIKERFCRYYQNRTNRIFSSYTGNYYHCAAAFLIAWSEILSGCTCRYAICYQAWSRQVPLNANNSAENFFRFLISADTPWMSVYQAFSQTFSMFLPFINQVAIGLFHFIVVFVSFGFLWNEKFPLTSIYYSFE